MAYCESIRALAFLKAWNLEHYLAGRLLDIGCGPEPILPGATGMNIPEHPGVLALSANPESSDMRRSFQEGYFDSVFSSHCLEHIRAPILETLSHWLHFVKPGGFLVLWLPDERYYVCYPENPKRRNESHLHYLTMDTFEWYAEQLQGARVLHLAPDVDVRNGKYSFLAVFQKV
jgi:predicted SAM-dependent methyltransferase